jgi:hypothetical protein
MVTTVFVRADFDTSAAADSAELVGGVGKNGNPAAVAVLCAVLATTLGRIAESSTFRLPLLEDLGVRPERHAVEVNAS